MSFGIMSAFYRRKDRRRALLRGGATLFDISGTGVLPKVVRGSLKDDMAALRSDYKAIGADFWSVVHKESELEGQVNETHDDRT
jgi:hypothetical protein